MSTVTSDWRFFKVTVSFLFILVVVVEGSLTKVRCGPPTADSRHVVLFQARRPGFFQLPRTHYLSSQDHSSANAEYRIHDLRQSYASQCCRRRIYEVDFDFSIICYTTLITNYTADGVARICARVPRHSRHDIRSPRHHRNRWSSQKGGLAPELSKGFGLVCGRLHHSIPLRLECLVEGARQYSPLAKEFADL